MKRLRVEAWLACEVRRGNRDAHQGDTSVEWSERLAGWVRGRWLALLCVVVASQNAAAQSDWLKQVRPARSRYYVVRTDLPADDARALAEHMDLTCDSYVRLFSRLPVRTRRPTSLDLFLFAGRQDYLNTLQQSFGVDGSGSWGMCITRGNATVLVGFREGHSVDEMKPLLQHEGFHQFASQLFPDLPPWADEGLAEVFERGVPWGDQLALGAVSADDKRRLQMAWERQQFLPLAHLFAMDSAAWSGHVKGGQASHNYLQAWSLVHFFLFAEEGKYQVPFLSFLVGLNRTGNWQNAFVAAFGWPDLEALQQAWADYIQKLPVVDYRELAVRLQFLADGSAKLAEMEIYPPTIDALRRELRRIDFTWDVPAWVGERGEGEQTLRADQAELYTVPAAGLPAGSLAFHLVDKQGRPAGETKRAAVMPWDIVVDKVFLTEFSVRWRRRNGQLVYALAAKVQPPAAPRRGR